LKLLNGCSLELPITITQVKAKLCDMTHISEIIGIVDRALMAEGRSFALTDQGIMPRFYFDISNGGLTIDDKGTEFSNAHAARDAAIKTLPHLAKDFISDGPSREVLVLLRDEHGRALFTASLTLTAKWLVERA
jgi:hypothetical protein